VRTHIGKAKRVYKGRGSNGRTKNWILRTKFQRRIVEAQIWRVADGASGGAGARVSTDATVAFNLGKVIAPAMVRLTG
jgi:hypothetical protein